ncbi:MAG: AI-2E family transporter, partial [Okeania sp. SIO2H7]|nr:AI-2E family transporter [Okeania sp. SIO2H7]
VWILVSLLVGAQVWGILGLLIALPIAGFVKNTVNYLRYYSEFGVAESRYENKN